MLFVIFWLFAALGGVFLLVLYLFQDKLLYSPDFPPDSRTVFIRPGRFRINSWEEVFLNTIDGESIQTWLLKHPTNSLECPTLLYFHGNAGNISHRLPNITKLVHQLELNVFIVEYRGYGKSSGSPSEIGLQIDAQTAIDYLKENKCIDSTKIFSFGSSLGGAVAIDVTMRNLDSFRGMIIENSFTSILDMIESFFPLLKYNKYLCSIKWNSIDKIKNIDKELPVYFISGQYDEVVPPIHMTKLYEECGSHRKTLKCYPGYHNATYLCANYYEDMDEWINAILNERSSEKLEEI